MTLQEMPALVRALSEGVLTLTLNRPPAHALDLNLIEALHGALERAAADPHVRVVVLASSGHIFCAGHDLREIARHRDDPDGGRGYLRRLFDRCAAVMTALAEGPLPTIAVVDGIATAAGCQLVAACDIAFASDRASFQLPGVLNGGFCSTPLVAVSRAVPRKAALEMAFSGEAIDAAAALRIGLVNRVLPPEALPGAALDFARRLAARNPAAIARGKQVFAAQIGRPLAEAYALASDAMIARFLDPAADAALERYRPAGGRRD
ncbi:MAG: enoyl-CoA hydratase [Alphaproteobacteria bacterium]|nr:MAG: enoyl-CoA hydratase [Alphaproteobacteria bacterium]